MSHNEPAVSIPKLAQEILDRSTSRSYCQQERVAYSEATWTPVEEVGVQLKQWFGANATAEQLALLKSAPFMK